MYPHSQKKAFKQQACKQASMLASLLACLLVACLLASVNAGTSKAPKNRGLILAVATTAFIDETSNF